MPAVGDNGSRSLEPLSFEVEEEAVVALKKAYLGKMLTSGMSYNLQEEFICQGFADIRATPMGANLVLLEAVGEDDVAKLIDDSRDWLYNWVSEIRPWEPTMLDDERFVWVRLHGVPIHVWSVRFFAFLAASLGVFITVDDQTRNKSAFEVARMLIKVKSFKTLEENIPVSINGVVFVVRVVEERFGPMKSAFVTPEVLSSSTGDIYSEELESCNQSSNQALGRWEEDDELESSSAFENIRAVSAGMAGSTPEDFGSACKVASKNQLAVLSPEQPGSISLRVASPGRATEFEPILGHLAKAHNGSEGADYYEREGQDAGPHAAAHGTGSGDYVVAEREAQLGGPVSIGQLAGRGGPDPNVSLGTGQSAGRRAELAGETNNHLTAGSGAVQDPSKSRVTSTKGRRKIKEVVEGRTSKEPGQEEHSVEGDVSEATIQRCNEKFWRSFDETPTGKLWKIAQLVGVVGTEDDKVYEELIELMDRRDQGCLVRRSATEDAP